jgi:hypothetical protein
MLALGVSGFAGRLQVAKERQRQLLANGAASGSEDHVGEEQQPVSQKL